MADSFVTTKITDAAFSDGSTLSGAWTAEYDGAGLLVAVTDATFIVAGSGGVTRFTGAGTLPYADLPSDSSYEIHFLASPSGGSYDSLYVDWQTQHPSAFYAGTPSLYSSVRDLASGSPTIPLRLQRGGAPGSQPIVNGLPATEQDSDATALSPFGGVTVAELSCTTVTRAVITLSHDGAVTDSDGRLSGTGLTRTGIGTYSLAFTVPADLTAELRALSFTPTRGQVKPGGTVTTLLDLSVQDGAGSKSADTSLSVTAVCFLRGVMIATPSGEAAVESLRAGDLVTVIEHGIRVARPVIWTGGRRHDNAGRDRRDESFPIRIRRHAFADSIPHRDLLLTPEHCILTEAGLVPVRMLVNGRSVLVDRSIPAYDFFHVELERHGILLAEGLAAESYLDTGNRALFISAGAAIRPRQDIRRVAPLAVAREQVEPIWARLCERARGLGFGGGAAVRLTDQPELRLLLDTGRELAACWHNGRRHMFRIPSGARPIRLLSRAAKPADTVGPFVDDRRTLGVAIGRLVLWHGLTDVPVPLEALRSDGWHGVEAGCRWTDGHAALDLPVAEDETFLDVHVTATMLYPAAAGRAA